MHPRAIELTEGSTIPFITISQGLTIKVPTKGTTNWDETMRTDTFNVISAHDHSGNGNGNQLGTASISDDSITGAKIQLSNDEYIEGQNAAASGTINIIKVNSSDTLTLGATLASPVFSLPQIQDTSSDHQYVFAVSELAADRTVTLPLLTGNDEFVFKDHAVTLTNKTLDADNNTISNIANDEIKAAAAIAVNKLAAVTADRALVSDGSGFLSATSVTSTELGYVAGVTSAIQTQINGKLPTTLTTTGDVIYSSSGSTASRLAIGSSGEVLTVSGGVPVWQAPTAATPADTSKTGNYTATTADEFIRCDASSGDFTITLYAASGNAGKTLKILNTGASGVVTVDGNASETIGGDTLKYLSGGQSLTIECDGSNWQVVNYTTLTGYLSEEQTANTQGGTFTSGDWRTRTLNTSSGDFSNFGSLSSNQFTLDEGTYIIEAQAPAFQVNQHKLKLRNTSDSSDVLIGTSIYNATGNVPTAMAKVEGTFSISASKTFEIQHRGNTTRASDGFGVASNFSVVEVYTKVRITKVV